MADFEFDPITDMWDDDSAFAAAEREMHKYQPGALRTSASERGNQGVMSTLSASEMLMMIPTYRSGDEVLRSMEEVTSAYVTASAGDEDNEDGTLSPMDGLLPPDIKDMIARMRNKQSEEEVQELPPSESSSEAEGGTDTRALLANPNCTFQASDGGRASRKMIEDGRLSPNLVHILSVICQSLKIHISSGNTGTHAPRSLHYSQRFGNFYCQAIDIGGVTDPITGEFDDFAANKRSPVALKLYNVVNSITGPRRPTKVGGPFNPGWTDARTVWFSDYGHRNHVHLEHKENGSATPVEKPKVVLPGGTTLE